MSETSQRRAVNTYRGRLAERGMARFEVIGRDADRDLVRSIARRLAEPGPDADRLRAAARVEPAPQPSSKGGILRALLASPLAGSNLDLTREREEGRQIDF